MHTSPYMRTNIMHYVIFLLKLTFWSTPCWHTYAYVNTYSIYTVYNFIHNHTYGKIASINWCLYAFAHMRLNPYCIFSIHLAPLVFIEGEMKKILLWSFLAFKWYDGRLHYAVTMSIFHAYPFRLDTTIYSNTVL